MIVRNNRPHTDSYSFMKTFLMLLVRVFLIFYHLTHLENWNYASLVITYNILPHSCTDFNNMITNLMNQLSCDMCNLHHFAVINLYRFSFNIGYGFWLGVLTESSLFHFTLVIDYVVRHANFNQILNSTLCWIVCNKKLISKHFPDLLDSF